VSAAKSILLTGGNRGIGRLTVQELLRRGHYVVFTSRSPEAGEATRTELVRSIRGARLELRLLDLCSLSSVRALASTLIHDDRQFDVIVHNAGTLNPPAQRTLTADGIEQTLQVHTVGPYLLSTLLVPDLNRPSRLLFIGSDLHRPQSRGARVDFRFDDPFLDERYHPERAYKNAKLAQLWLMREWERRYGVEGIHADVLCPGFIPVTASATAHGAMKFLLRRVLPWMPFATAPDEAAYLEADWAEGNAAAAGGRYFDGRAIVDPSPEARDPELARALWSLLDEWAPTATRSA
jgi:NAD(P)-dependent dehydrogenase (short-subunit alcohol dehydrogenase family)